MWPLKSLSHVPECGLEGADHSRPSKHPWILNVADGTYMLGSHQGK